MKELVLELVGVVVGGDGDLDLAFLFVQVGLERDGLVLVYGAHVAALVAEQRAQGKIYTVVVTTHHAHRNPVNERKHEKLAF